MKDKKALYDLAMTLLEGCNTHLKDDEKINTINTKLAGVVKDLSDIIIRDTTVTNLKPEDVK